MKKNGEYPNQRGRISEEIYRKYIAMRKINPMVKTVGAKTVVAKTAKTVKTVGAKTAKSVKTVGAKKAVGVEETKNTVNKPR